MTFQAAFSDEELIRRVNRRLMPELKQCAILCEWAEPVSLPALQDLTRCRLFNWQWEKGEVNRHRPRLTDPDWVARQRCHVCGGKLVQIGENDRFVCRNARCIIRGKQVAKATVRGGVTSVLWNQAFVAFHKPASWQTPVDTGVLVDVRADEVETVEKQIPWLNRCIACLDRRYDASELAAIYRTIGCLADQKGWKLKQPAE